MLVVEVAVLVIALVERVVLAVAATERQLLRQMEHRELQILAAAEEVRLVDYLVLLLAAQAVAAS
jgi:hypothetical protein